MEEGNRVDAVADDASVDVGRRGKVLATTGRLLLLFDGTTTAADRRFKVTGLLVDSGVPPVFGSFVTATVVA